MIPDMALKKKRGGERERKRERTVQVGNVELDNTRTMNARHFFVPYVRTATSAVVTTRTIRLAVTS